MGIAGIASIYNAVAALIAAPEVMDLVSGGFDWTDDHLTDVLTIHVGVAVAIALVPVLVFEARRKKGEGPRKLVLGGATLVAALSLALVVVSLVGPTGPEGPQIGIGPAEAVADAPKRQEKRPGGKQAPNAQPEEGSTSGAIASAETEPESGTSSAPPTKGKSSSGCVCPPVGSEAPPRQPEGSGVSPEQSFGEESAREAEQEAREEREFDQEFEEEFEAEEEDFFFE